MGRGSQSSLKKADRGSRTWQDDDDISSEKVDFIKCIEINVERGGRLG